jgi:nicotinamidase/pyrazinamidase
MIDRKEENTAVLVVDVQGDFTRLMDGSLAVEGTGQDYIDQVTAETRRL